MGVTLTAIYKKILPCIVSIEGMKRGDSRNQEYFFQPFGHHEPYAGQKMSFGSGMVIHPKGYILTCYHVVEGIDSARIKRGNQKDYYTGKVIWSYPEKDLAIVQIFPRKKLPIIRFTSTDEISVGQKVFAIGNPFGFEHTLTSGVVSGKERSITTKDREYEGVLQTDAALNPGNSGGPLFNKKGLVVGMNAVMVQSFQNVGFALTAKEFMPHIRRFLPQET